MDASVAAREGSGVLVKVYGMLHRQSKVLVLVLEIYKVKGNRRPIQQTLILEK